jgi:hypothetical protein
MARSSCAEHRYFPSQCGAPITGLMLNYLCFTAAAIALPCRALLLAPVFRIVHSALGEDPYSGPPPRVQNPSHPFRLAWRSFA